MHIIKSKGKQLINKINQKWHNYQSSLKMRTGNDYICVEACAVFSAARSDKSRQEMGTYHTRDIGADSLSTDWSIEKRFSVHAYIQCRRL